MKITIEIAQTDTRVVAQIHRLVTNSRHQFTNQAQYQTALKIMDRLRTAAEQDELIKYLPDGNNHTL